ncbi:hypothetical protein C8R44DRAFT_886553 [Mycena epipterygia]|nr:hypothetical protein C8R44DRAFT_886553 [Mycena epipterygia]
MPIWFNLLLLVALVDCAGAVTLSLPDKISTGTPIDVQWTRDTGDPTSFGLMQRSLQGNQPVLSVTPVANSAGATTGTVAVTFGTAGQVLLAVVSQLALSSGEKPNQLSAGKQLTVSVGVTFLDTTQTEPQSTRTTTILQILHTSSAVPAQGNGAPSTTTSASPILSKSAAAATAPASQSPTGTPVNGSSSSATATIPAASNILASGSLSPPSSSSSSPSNPSSTPSAIASTSGPRNTSKNRGVIAAAVIIPIFALFFICICMIRRQRTSTRNRIALFQNIWTRRSSSRGTISSFGLDVESAMGSGTEPAASSTGTAAHTGERKLQVMVDALTERNAALQREMVMISSGSVSGLEHARFSDGAPSEEPPPVYVESAESSPQSPRSRPPKPR